MTTMSDVPSKDEWTSSDLDSLPEDGVRREIFDGVLRATPSPSSVHRTLAALLLSALTQTCPDHLFVSQANDVELAANRVYIPDLLVVTFEAAKSRRGKFAASEVVLAAEIMSPSTRGVDSVTKPSYYARAGIPFFWLIDTSGGLSVTAFELDPDQGVYEQVAVFADDDTVRLEQPWAIEIPLTTVRPRNL